MDPQRLTLLLATVGAGSVQLLIASNAQVSPLQILMFLGVMFLVGSSLLKK